MSEYSNEPTWLTSLVDQRMALMEDKGEAILRTAAATGTPVMTFLTEPDEDTKAAHEHWEHSCTNCRAFLPGQLYGGHITRRSKAGAQVVMTFDVCEKCKSTFTD